MRTPNFDDYHEAIECLTRRVKRLEDALFRISTFTERAYSQIEDDTPARAKLYLASEAAENALCGLNIPDELYGDQECSDG